MTTSRLLFIVLIGQTPVLILAKSTSQRIDERFAAICPSAETTRLLAQENHELRLYLVEDEVRHKGDDMMAYSGSHRDPAFQRKAVQNACERLRHMDCRETAHRIAGHRDPEAAAKLCEELRGDYLSASACQEAEGASHDHP